MEDQTNLRRIGEGNLNVTENPGGAAGRNTGTLGRGKSRGTLWKVGGGFAAKRKEPWENGGGRGNQYDAALSS